MAWCGRHFGEEIIADRLGTTVKDPKVMTLWLKLYKVSISYILLSM